jgi:hypothetical protein
VIPEAKVMDKVPQEINGSVLNFSKSTAGFLLRTMIKVMTVKKMQAIQMRVMKTLIPKIDQK